MVQDCPECGSVNPHDTESCACGYDFCARQIDPSRACASAPVPSVLSSRLSHAGAIVALVGLTILVLGLGGPVGLAWIPLGLAFMIGGFGLFAFFLFRAHRGTQLEDATRVHVGFFVAGMATMIAHVTTVWLLWFLLLRPAGFGGDLSFWLYVGGLALAIPTSVVGGLVGARLFAARA
jgi:hypothetical protein